MKTLFLKTVLPFLLLCTCTAAWGQTTVSMNFSPPDTVVTWIVPPGNDSIQVTVAGAPGGLFRNSLTGFSEGQVGRGYQMQTRMDVTPGDTLYFFIGGTGRYGLNTGSVAFNGGGAGADGTYGGAGGGGGASDVRRGGRELANRILIAGGGGGASYEPSQSSAAAFRGGNGGFSSGGSGYYNGLQGPQAGGGEGGQSNGGGSGGVGPSGTTTGNPGTLGMGGAGGNNSGGGGGGGGRYGGGGGSAGGGGGGNSYVAPSSGIRLIQHTVSNALSGYVFVTYTVPSTGVVDAVASVISRTAVVPNPSGTAATLNFDLKEDDLIFVQATDILGKMLWQRSTPCYRGANTISLPSEELPAGLYFIRVITTKKNQPNSIIQWQKN